MTATLDPIAAHEEAQRRRVSARVAADTANAGYKRKLAEAEEFAKEAERLAEDKARGNDIGDKLSAALEAGREARVQAAQLKLEADAAARAQRSEEARMHQLLIADWDAFVEQIRHEKTPRLEAAVEALREPLTEYLTAWDDAARMWRRLGPATQSQVLERDRKVGQYRDISLVMQDASVPECPLAHNIVHLLNTVTPEPRFMSQPEPEEGDDGVDIADVT